MHDGFFLRLGIPFIGSRVNYRGRANTTDVLTPRPPNADISGFGAGFELALGATPAQGLVLAGEFLGMTDASPGVSPSGARPAFSNIAYARLGFLVDWYPNPRQGLHVLGGAGLSQLRLSSHDGYNNGNSDASLTDLLSGVYLSLGIGHEWWVSQQWSIGVLFRLEASSLKSSGNYEPIGADASYSAASLGVSFTYH